MDNTKKLTNYSKFLSLVLRHDPGKIGIQLDDAGWTDVKALLKKAQDHKRAKGLTRDLLQTVVETNNKKRFEFSDDGKRIRARQGHSVKVELGDEQKVPPEILFHGTATRFEQPIRSAGLLKMSRHAVHLSSDEKTARNVGNRHGKPVILQVQAKKMHDDGFKFYLTGNGVWYTDHVPTDYLLWPGDRHYQGCQPTLRV